MDRNLPLSVAFVDQSKVHPGEDRVRPRVLGRVFSSSRFAGDCGIREFGRIVRSLQVGHASSSRAFSAKVRGSRTLMPRLFAFDSVRLRKPLVEYFVAGLRSGNADGHEPLDDPEVPDRACASGNESWWEPFPREMSRRELMVKLRQMRCSNNEPGLKSHVHVVNACRHRRLCKSMPRFGSAA